MARIHLFEFEDLPWFPGLLRNYMTDFLQFLSNRTGMYAPMVPALSAMLGRLEEPRIIDLGSGGGGGLIRLNAELRREVPGLEIRLTDRYPNVEAFRYTQSKADNFTYSTVPVDAREVPVELRGLRTLFLSLHHFRPQDARQILRDAVADGQPIAVIEAQERSVPSILAMLFSPLSVLIATPFIRPFRWGRLLFTYLIPLVPLFVLWDGVVSSLRTYSVPEMEALIAGVEGKDRYNWDVGRRRAGPGAILYLIGSPKLREE